MSVSLTLMILMIVSGCTFPLKVDDRLSYATQQKLVERYRGAPLIAFSVDEASRELTVTEFASGFVRGGAKMAFPIGWTFTAYLEQVQKTAFSYGNDPSPLALSIRITSCDIRYTNSAISGIVDWVDITLRIETTYPGQSSPVQSSLRQAVDLPVEETVQGYANSDRAFVLALELLVRDYVDAVLRYLKTAKMP